ncbi:MAG: hydrolase, partial [Alphaproteobacteria bacterium]|nr:hydrolase [Alphaproteobacteria bacterium]
MKMQQTMPAHPLATSSAPTCPGPIEKMVKPSWKVPANACDSHAHVCGPADKYPYWQGRIYTPPDALVSDYRRLLDALGIERGVV